MGGGGELYVGRSLIKVLVAGVFGQSLEETVLYERRYGMRLVPLVVEQCVSFIRERGLQEVGLFRQPGQTSQVRELQEAFDSGERPSFDRYVRLQVPHEVPCKAFGDEAGCVFCLQQDRRPHGGVSAEALPQAAARAAGSLQPLPRLPALRTEANRRPLGGNFIRLNTCSVERKQSFTVRTDVRQQRSLTPDHQRPKRSL